MYSRTPFINHSSLFVQTYNRFSFENYLINYCKYVGLPQRWKFSRLLGSSPTIYEQRSSFKSQFLNYLFNDWFNPGILMLSQQLAPGDLCSPIVSVWETTRDPDLLGTLTARMGALVWWPLYDTEHNRIFYLHCKIATLHSLQRRFAAKPCKGIFC